MKTNKKVTPELKEVMREMRSKGLSYKAIGNVLAVSQNTVIYHLDEKQRKKVIARALNNPQQRDRKEYMRKYAGDRYKNDEEYRERIKKANRENQRKKYQEKHGKH